MDQTDTSSRHGRVILLSPNELVRDALHAWLTRAGYAVDACATEEEAAARLGGRGARVFVTTELLPRGTALPTLSVLRERWPETAILFIDEGPLRPARDALLPTAFARVCGVDATVAWPFDRRAVMAAIEAVDAEPIALGAAGAIPGVAG